MESSKSFYSVLGVSTDSSDKEIKRAYRRLAMQWHPDKWSRTPSLVGGAKQKFQQVQEAYSVLSIGGSGYCMMQGFTGQIIFYCHWRLAGGLVISFKKCSLLWMMLRKRKRTTAWRNSPRF